MLTVWSGQSTSLLNDAAARVCIFLLSGASDSSSKNDLRRPACSEQTNENLTIAQSVRISAAFEMALRLSSLLIASRMWDVQRRRRGKWTSDAVARGICSFGSSNMLTFEVLGVERW
jgi:hypothetical protein